MKDAKTIRKELERDRRRLLIWKSELAALEVRRPTLENRLTQAKAELDARGGTDGFLPFTIVGSLFYWLYPALVAMLLKNGLVNLLGDLSEPAQWTAVGSVVFALVMLFQSGAVNARKTINQVKLVSSLLGFVALAYLVVKTGGLPKAEYPELTMQTYAVQISVYALFVCLSTVGINHWLCTIASRLRQIRYDRAQDRVDEIDLAIAVKRAEVSGGEGVIEATENLLAAMTRA